MTAVDLPAYLRERVAPHAASPRPGSFVMYWMKAAVRAHENPALDVAVVAARALGLPVFVYHALSQRYRYASDRHHTFILEGARDVQAECRARGIGYAFHLERAGAGPVLLELAEQAALVVTDLLPVAPFPRWERTVEKHAPLWRVDASCLAPVWSFKPGDEWRAFRFRESRLPIWEAALAQTAWPEVEAPNLFLPELPFEPVDLSQADIPALVAACDIDHSIPAVSHSRGGTVAGLERWKRFLDGPIDAYARSRNDPLSDGVSHMSPYHHYGHVSPFQISREARARHTDGAEKFLDEVLTWRELAWTFCAHVPSHETIDVLPAWARDTLQRHQADPREHIYSWDTLAHAKTGDPLWDAAQRSLLLHGELHNNVRMTWGKAFLGWTKNAADALALSIDLNHRYALDGRDPASYGGLLWCLGLFDRPFIPEQPISGSVRPRLTKDHARRFDVAAYAARVESGEFKKVSGTAAQLRLF